MGEDLKNAIALIEILRGLELKGLDPNSLFDLSCYNCKRNSKISLKEMDPTLIGKHLSTHPGPWNFIVFQNRKRWPVTIPTEPLSATKISSEPCPEAIQKLEPSPILNPPASDEQVMEIPLPTEETEATAPLDAESLGPKSEAGSSEPERVTIQQIDDQAEDEKTDEQEDGQEDVDSFIFLWRKSIWSQTFQDEGLWKTWTWCLMKAKYRSGWVPVKTGKGTTQVFVKRGQFVFQRGRAAKELKMKEATLYDRMKKLATMGNLKIGTSNQANKRTNNQYTIVSVVNYKKYQASVSNEPTTKPAIKPTTNKSSFSNDQPTTNQRPTSNQSPAALDRQGFPSPNKVNKENKERKKGGNSYSDSFESFWKEYPKRNKKGQTFKEWEKLKPEVEPGLEVVLAALRNQIAHKAKLKAASQFCPEWPDPERWIKYRRWEDEVSQEEVERPKEERIRLTRKNVPEERERV